MNFNWYMAKGVKTYKNNLLEHWQWTSQYVEHSDMIHD